MTTFGYARVSTDDQSLDIQRETLKAAGCEMIREEKRSGSTLEVRGRHAPQATHAEIDAILFPSVPEQPEN